MASSKAKMAIWAVPLLAVVGFGGFGAINFSGNLRSIGTVGDTDISANEYALALRNALRAQAAENGQAVTMEQARQSGLADAVLTQVVTQAALNDETARLGISVGDETVVQELRNVSTFQGPDG